MLLCPRCAAPCEQGHRFCFSCGAELGPPERTEDDPLIGRTLPGGYRVTHLVGVGGMGRVYCAEQVTLARTVAVKVMHPSLGEEEQTAARFLNEARAASRLSHPNSVAIYDFGRTDDRRPYIVMEYLRGRDLARVVADDGPMPVARLAGLLNQTLAALEEAHALGIVHRDLKPDNLVLEPLKSGRDFVKVVDFGLAKILENDEKAPGGRALTRPGLVCGTPDYMSPEQARGETLDGRSDLYSLGVVLYEMLAGRVPFESDSATNTLLMHLTEKPRDPRDVAPDRGIPAPFAEVALRALAKAPKDRFQTAHEFSDAIKRALAESEGVASDGVGTGVRCRACGALNPLDQKFCGECGVPTARVPSNDPGRPSPPIGHPLTLDALSVRTVAEGSGGRAHLLPLLAREDATAWLEERHRQSEVVLAAAHVVGDAGMGKTRLLGEMLTRWADRGDVVATVGPDPAWAKVGDHAVRAAVRVLAGWGDSAIDPSAWDGASLAAARGLVHLFGRASKVPVRSTGEVPDRRADVAEALRWGLERGAQRARSGVAVLAVDDLDFVDGTSRNAVVDVLADPPPVAALVVVTYAPGARLVSASMPDEMWSLSPLPYDSFAARVPEKLAVRGVPLPPLHVEELVAWSRETNEAAPERLPEIIARRAERLPPDARHALHAIAIWGDDAGAEKIAEILGPGTDVAAAIDVLSRARMVVVEPAGVRVSHPLVRRTVLSGIPAGRREELAQRISDLTADAPLDVRAKHAMHAGSSLEALSLLDALSMRRAAHGDVFGSVAALRHALDISRRELHRGELDDPLSAVLLFARKLAEALITSEQWSDAQGVLREALGMTPPTSEHRPRLAALLARVKDDDRAKSSPAPALRYRVGG